MWRLKITNLHPRSMGLVLFLVALICAAAFDAHTHTAPPGFTRTTTNKVAPACTLDGLGATGTCLP